MERKIIALYILDSNEKEKFLTGETGEYTVTGLDFSKIPAYNFKDGNNYHFISCVFNNVSVSFVNECIHISHPTVIGNVMIHNEGVAAEDLIMIDFVENSEDVKSLTVESPYIGIFDSNIHPTITLKLIAEEVTVENCKLASKDFLIDFLVLSEIRDSKVNGVSFRKQEGLAIERSYINDTFINDNSQSINQEEQRNK